MEKKANIYRLGKTQRDARSHAKQRNYENKQARAAWNNEQTMRRSQNTFPFHSCNGKRNRSVITGHKGTRRVLTWTIHNSMR